MLQYSDLEVTLYFAHCIYPIMVVDTSIKQIASDYEYPGLIVNPGLSMDSMQCETR